MILLLDTHTFIWFAEQNPQLSASARSAIALPETDVFLSVASIWEMAIKVSIGSLELKRPLATYVERAVQFDGIELLAIDVADAVAVAGLVYFHRDPFDRLIIAQALRRDWTVVTKDARFAEYGVKTLW